jgi:enhancing lycopene biosynthesis protein 2
MYHLKCIRSFKHVKSYATSTTTTKPHRNKSVAVILSGCGVYDGSEIHESVSILLGLAQAGAKVKCYAPNIKQAHVVNHLTQTPTEESRNVLEESARIARGDIDDIKNLNVDLYDAAFFPGGFGAAKNLSNFAFTQDAEYTVIPEVEEVLKKFHQNKKPIGLCCISPILAAKVFPNCKVTIGSDEGTAGRITSVGSSNVVKNVEEVYIDKDNLLVTTPAYMTGTTLDKIFEGIQRMVNNVLQLAPEKGI